MVREPVSKRVITFIDGQNLFHAAREAFGYTYPNYNVLALSKAICREQGWSLKQVRFYTGIPDPTDDAFWNQFWSAKLLTMGRNRIYVYSRSLRYRNRGITLPDGTKYTIPTSEEKGIDIRIALDVIRLARQSEYDVAVIFSQDQDFSEVAEEIRSVAQQQRRWVKIASAFPVSPTTRNTRGINKTDWIQIDRATYEACIDPHDYRLKQH